MLRRTARYALNTVTLLSLLLCLTTCGLWTLSHLRADCIEWGQGWPLRAVPSGTAVWTLISDSGSFYFSRTRYQTAPTTIVRVSGPVPDPITHGIKVAGSANLPTGYIWRSGSGVSSPGFYTSSEWYIAAPCWSAAALFALTSVWLIQIRQRRSQRVTNNLCQACGYDLRATPNRCPECGTPSQKTGPTAS